MKFLSVEDFLHPLCDQNRDDYVSLINTCDEREILMIEYQGIDIFDIPISDIAQILGTPSSIMFPEGDIASKKDGSFSCRWKLATGSDPLASILPIGMSNDGQPTLYTKPVNPTSLRIGDFFSGVGGFSAGFDVPPFQVHLGVDKNAYASAAWKVGYFNNVLSSVQANQRTL